MQERTLLCVKIGIVCLATVLLWLALLPFVLDGSRYQGLGAVVLLIYTSLLAVIGCLSEWTSYEMNKKRKQKEEDTEEPK